MNCAFLAQAVRFYLPTPLRVNKKYTKEDWERINKIQMNNLKELCDLYNSKVPHDNPMVQAVVEKSHKFIHDTFYPCTLEMFSGLGNMYITDERFTAYYEKFAPGLAAYYNDAIQHYSANA